MGLSYTDTDGMSQTFDGYLVGSDRSKDLVVLRINAPQVSYDSFGAFSWCQ